MKTTVYILLAIFIFGIIAPGFINKNKAEYRINIQAVDTNATPDLLAQSAKMISNRLENFSKEKFEIVTIPDKNQIQVSLNKNWDLKYAEKLILHKGTLELYAAFNYNDFCEVIKDNQLLSLFQTSTSNKWNVQIGCIADSQVHKINDYLNSIPVNQQCKFAWGSGDNSNACLYALKLNNGNGVLLKGPDMEGFKFDQGQKRNSFDINFKFKSHAVPMWAEITKRNIEKPIAIVLDNNVLCAPIVRGEINNGNCMISGNFTQTEAKYISIIGNSGELPLTFRMIK